MNEDKATHYHRLRRRARGVGAVGGVALLVAFWVTGASAGLRDVCRGLATLLGLRGWSEDLTGVAVYLLALCVTVEVVAFPLAAYRGFVLDRTYGLSTEGFWRWGREHLKASGLATVLAVATGSVAFTALRWSAAWWWAPTWALLSAGSVALAFVAPVWLFPLFFRLEPLDRKALVDRLVTLARRAGAPVLGVYQWHLGERTRAANAALVGLGGTRRILVSDTLLGAYTDEEIEVILAHELAHHVHGDLWTALGVESGLTLGALALAHVLLPLGVGVGGVQAPSDVAVVPLLLLVVMGWSVAAMPVVNGLSRAHERRADRFALDLTRNPDAFVSAMRRLGAQNLADEQPSRLTTWLFHSHPPLPERMEAARRWTAPA